MMQALAKTFEKVANRVEDEKDVAKFKRIAGLWRTRVYMFAHALFDPEVQNRVKYFHDGFRKVKGTPDYPYSLMEGVAGEVYFLSELLTEDDDMRFPGYEV